MSLSREKSCQEYFNYCDKRLRQYPHRYPVPKFHTRYPIKRNAIDITHEHRHKEWVYSLYPSSQLRADRFLKVGKATSIVAFFYSLPTRVDRYAELIKMMVSFFILDDHTECGYGDVGRDVDQCRLMWTQFMTMFDNFKTPGSVPMSEWRPYLLGMYPVFKGISDTYTEQQRERYVHVFKEYAEGNIEETVALRDGVVFTSIEQLLEIRLKTIGARLILQTMEYAYEFCLTDSEWADPRLQELLDLSTEITVLVNDIFSFEKEALNESYDLRRMFNAVALTAILDGCSVMEAMDAIIGRIATKEERLYCVSRDILTDGQGYSPAMEMMVRCVFYYTGGNLKYTTTLDRYHMFNKA
ncbi:unnamed protein product [Oppiella nova]|uniref:Terpene synthase n=1 Tax=Oppiella nova TaxID=334625 RepID=A0A7R9QQF5_9ACAR|nr:unnamed protein product [Oppiella nova]CAG2170522.1 unnamed protein product [Oppiella nova]